MSLALRSHIISLFLFLLAGLIAGCSEEQIIKTTAIGQGWANNSVNAVIFRGKALTTYQDVQFAAYYDAEGRMVLAKRELGDQNWKTHISRYSGNVEDAHNSISLAVDSDGFLHVSWDQHNTPLRYVKSTEPFGLELSQELSMTGLQEERVTYPQFFNLPNEKLLFSYRSGESGRGNMVLNEYNPDTEQWIQLQNNLLDGEEQRSAYWQMHVAENGDLHLSWVWRETWDVASNHDMAYAVSSDGGRSWKKSNGEAYDLPITETAAELAWEIPENSELINQTAMTVDENGNPYITTYWNAGSKPQFKIIYLEEGRWKLMDTGFRESTFSLSGGGTKRIPISRPEILMDENYVYLLFRDEERDSKITVAGASLDKKKWTLKDVTEQGVGQWEPNYDVELWNTKRELHIFSQKVEQVDGEGVAEVAPKPVQVIEIENLQQLFENRN
ncbi:BNR repeat-containing protein [Gracilimonas mengyeensis]|uniref:BNR repeat-containing family member n=1 Tax=Gracilimonas mengyeensis TaxID=1302730 RepID=A0A521BSM7_9BACT|nr:BNR repeat-containing protein [Gracilimonas mengyeensis]SMO50154.1 BNR repeat-containing family member [Gracilimonas mengyeensis]